jgi:hypothetical protein
MHVQDMRSRCVNVHAGSGDEQRAPGAASHHSLGQTRAGKTGFGDADDCSLFLQGPEEVGTKARRFLISQPNISVYDNGFQRVLYLGQDSQQARQLAAVKVARLVGFHLTDEFYDLARAALISP